VKSLGAFASMCIGFWAWWYLLSSERSTHGLAPGVKMNSTQWWSYILAGYLIMLVGIFLGIACRRLIERRNQGEVEIEIIPFLRTTIRQIDLWVSLLGSPLLYGSILKTGADLAFWPFSYFALQSGFSAYVLVNALLGGNAGKPRRGARSEHSSLRC
jgi:hypothetical protein